MGTARYSTDTRSTQDGTQHGGGRTRTSGGALSELAHIEHHGGDALWMHCVLSVSCVCPSLPMLMQHMETTRRRSGGTSARSRRQARAIGSWVFPEVIGGRGAELAVRTRLAVSWLGARSGSQLRGACSPAVCPIDGNHLGMGSLRRSSPLAQH
jgi:hypothetical protein